MKSCYANFKLPSNYPLSESIQKTSDPEQPFHCLSKKSLNLASKSEKSNFSGTNPSKLTPVSRQSKEYIASKLGSTQEFAQKAQMNNLYEQNQKLRYRINYLNDQNNYYKISINNVQKLNHNLHKYLSHQHQINDIKGKINTKKVSNHQKTQTAGTYFSRTVSGTQNMNKNSYSSQVNKNVLEKFDAAPTEVSPSLGSFFSLISNKIHLKNLQMKVGNSIRKTEKLKKIYECSISTLTKKAELLQIEVNKLARQAEYNSIEFELLQNIYKADGYMRLNEDWVEGLQSQKKMDQSIKGQSNNSSSNSLQSVIEGALNNDFDDLQVQKYADCFKKNQVNQAKNLNIDDQQEKRVKTNLVNCKKSIVRAITQKSPMAVRFFSGEFNNIRLTNNFKLQSLSTACPKQKLNYKLSSILLSRSPIQCQLQFQPNVILSGSNQLRQDLIEKSDNNYIQNMPQKFRSQKQLFKVPAQDIELILSQLEKQQISLCNKLESLRKEEREQKKTNFQLLQTIQELFQKKKNLKLLIQQQFSLFFRSNTSVNQINALKKKTAQSSQIVESKNKSRTLYHLPATLKVQQSSGQQKNAPWTSIQQLKKEADELYLCNLYQKQLIDSIQKQDKLLQEQHKLNQQYKQKIMDRSEQQNKELKVLEEEVNKCMEQVKQIKAKCNIIFSAKGKNIIKPNANSNSNA